MDHHEYVKLLLEIILTKIIQQYKIQDLEHQCFMYMEIQKGMYGLPQAENIYNNILKQQLSILGYEPAPITPILCHHKISPIKCSLVVDDFRIKYERHSDITHLLDKLTKIYKIS